MGITDRIPIKDLTEREIREEFLILFERITYALEKQVEIAQKTLDRINEIK